MNKKAVVTTAVAVLGLVTGPISLQTATECRPPIDQSALIFITLGTLIGPIFTLGFQAARKDPKPLVYGWYFFAVGAIYFLATGLSAAGLAAANGAFGPPALLFLSVGIGVSLGLLACRKLFTSRFIANP